MRKAGADMDDLFQSTLSVRRATVHHAEARVTHVISIHALRKESDRAFRPTPLKLLFQSTLSVRRATQLLRNHDQAVNISIHALRKESDRSRRGYKFFDLISIHALRKESDHLSSEYYPIYNISIHALRKESDHRPKTHVNANMNFNPRSP